MGKNGGSPSQKGYFERAPWNRLRLKLDAVWLRTARVEQPIFLKDGKEVVPIRGVVRRTRPPEVKNKASNGLREYMIVRLSGEDVVVKWRTSWNLIHGGLFGMMGHVKDNHVVPFHSVPGGSVAWSTKAVENLSHACEDYWFFWLDFQLYFKSERDAMLAKLML